MFRQIFNYRNATRVIRCNGAGCIIKVAREHVKCQRHKQSDSSRNDCDDKVVCNIGFLFADLTANFLDLIHAILIDPVSRV